MGKYDDLIGGFKVEVDVVEVLNEAAANKLDDRIKQQKAELEKPIEINVKSNKAENQLKALHKAAKQVKDDLQDAISNQKGFEEVNKLVTKYGHLKKQIGDIAPVVGKNNTTLKESNQILKDTKKLVDQLTVSQEKLNKTSGKTKTGKVDTIGSPKEIEQAFDTVEDKIKDAKNTYETFSEIVEKTKRSILGTDFNDIFHTRTVEGYAASLEKVRDKMAEIKDAARDARREYEDIVNTMASYTGIQLGGKSDFQKAIKDAWHQGDHAMAAKLFDSYQKRFPKGAFKPENLFGAEWSNNFDKNLTEANARLALHRTQLQRTAEAYGTYSALMSLQGMERQLTDGYNTMLQERAEAEKAAAEQANMLADAQKRFATNDVVTAQKNLNAAIDEYNAKVAESNRLLEEKRRIEGLDNYENEPWYNDYEFPVNKIMEISHQFAAAEDAANLFKIALKEAVRVYRELGGDMKLPLGADLVKEIDIPVKIAPVIDAQIKTPKIDTVDEDELEIIQKENAALEEQTVATEKLAEAHEDFNKTKNEVWDKQDILTAQYDSLGKEIDDLERKYRAVIEAVKEWKRLNADISGIKSNEMKDFRKQLLSRLSSVSPELSKIIGQSFNTGMSNGFKGIKTKDIFNMVNRINNSDLMGGVSAGLYKLDNVNIDNVDTSLIQSLQDDYHGLDMFAKAINILDIINQKKQAQVEITQKITEAQWELFEVMGRETAYTNSLIPPEELARIEAARKAEIELAKVRKAEREEVAKFKLADTQEGLFAQLKALSNARDWTDETIDILSTEEFNQYMQVLDTLIKKAENVGDAFRTLQDIFSETPSYLSQFATHATAFDLTESLINAPAGQSFDDLIDDVISPSLAAPGKVHTLCEYIAQTIIGDSDVIQEKQEALKAQLKKLTELGNYYEQLKSQREDYIHSSGLMKSYTTVNDEPVYAHIAAEADKIWELAAGVNAQINTIDRATVEFLPIISDDFKNKLENDVLSAIGEQIQIPAKVEFDVGAQTMSAQDQVKAIEDAYETAGQKVDKLRDKLSDAIKEQEELEKHAKLYGYTLGMTAREAGKVLKTLEKDNRAQYVEYMLKKDLTPIVTESGRYGFDRPDLGKDVYNQITKTEYNYALYLLEAVDNLNVGWEDGLRILASLNGQLDTATQKVVQLTADLENANKESALAYERMSYAHSGVLGDDKITAHKQMLASKSATGNSVSDNAKAIESAQEDITESTTQTNEIIIRSYDELLKATTRYVELAKQLKPTSTPEYDEIDQAIDSSRYLDDIDEAIAQVTSWYTNVQRLKSSKKQGLSRYMHTYSDGEQREFEIENDSLQRAELTLQGYIYRAFADFGYEFVDALKKSSTKKIQSFVDKTLDKYFKVVDANEAYEIGASAFNGPIKEVMTNIYETIMSSVEDATKRDAEEILDDLKARSSRVNRYTLSSETGRLGRYMGITTPYDEAVSNAKKIESYKELCEVLGTYHELLSRNYIYSGDNPPGFSESEEQLFRDMKARITATGGKDIWNQANFGEFNTDKLATALGIELPKAADAAEQNIAEVREELKALNEEASKTATPATTVSPGISAPKTQYPLAVSTPTDLAAQQTIDAVNDAAQAIELEGEAAAKAAPKKKKFADANREVASSGLVTKDGIDEASGAMENEGKSAQEYANEVLNALSRINSLNTEIDKLKGQNKYGFFSGQIDSMQKEKSALLSTIGQIAQEVNSKFNLGLSGADVDGNALGALARFFKSAGDSADISSKDVNKFVDSVRAAEKFATDLNAKYQDAAARIQTLRQSIAGTGLGNGEDVVDKKDDGGADYYGKMLEKYLIAQQKYDSVMAEMQQSGKSPIDWTGDEAMRVDNAIAGVEKYGNAVYKVMETERQYFAGKKQYISGDTTMSSMAKDAEDAANKTNNAKQMLVDAANEFAQASGASGAIVTKFVQGADGIARLDFSVLEKGTNTLQKFQMAAGRATEGIFITENNIKDQSVSIQNAAKQLEQMQQLKEKLEAHGVSSSDSSLNGLIEKINELDKALTAENQDVTKITKIAQDSKISMAEADKLYKKMLELDALEARLGDDSNGANSGQSSQLKSIENQITASKQLLSMQELVGRLGASGVNTEDGSAPAQVQKLLNLMRQLKEAKEAGDQDMITKLAKDAKLTEAEIDKLYKKMYQLDDLIASGQATGLGKGNPTGNAYNQLVDATKQWAEGKGAAVEFGHFDAATNTLNASLVKANGTVENFKVSMNGLNGQMAAQQTGVNKLTSTWDAFKSSISKVGKQMMTAFVGANVFYKAISEVRKGIGYVKEIDLALTELKKVTDETEASYAQFLNTAASTAGKIGSTVSDFTEATSNFARLGYTMEESANMAETAIVYRNVADGLDTVEEATDSIISTMKAFGIESNNTMGIVDRFNEVGNNFAITSAGIGEALQRSVSALYAGGNTIDESIALVTAANSV